MKKKRRIKKSVILACITIITIELLILWPYLFTEIKLYGNKQLLLDYGEKYSDPGYKVTFFGKKISKNIKVSDNIKKDLGNYIVRYKYKPKYALIPVVKKRKIIRKDLSGPNIELISGDKIEITINTEYIDPGYKAIDNLDGDVTKDVKVSGNVDVTKLGEYEVKYTVSDKAGNVSKKTRIVKVEKIRPTQMSLTEYTLDGWYDEVKLKETENKGEAYYNSIKLLGDSNVMHMYYDGLIKYGNAWAIPCLHAESMFTTKINIYETGEEILMLDAIKKYQPEKIILNFGTFSTSWIEKDVFMKNANKMLDEIKETSPNTKVALISMYPIDPKVEKIDKFYQKKINEYNFYILEMAYQHNIYFLDVSSILKGDDGYVNKNYIRDDGYHLNYLGYSKVKEYIMTHSF